MSYQVIITFDLDENKIQENAEKEAGRQVARKVVDEAFGSSYSQSGNIRAYVQQAIREIIEPEKDMIIDKAIKEVVGSLCRTKLVKEKLQEVMEDE